MHFCRLALKLADSETDINVVNLIRSLLCYLLYGEKMYYDAIVMGDFLTRRYSESPNARQCAKIMLASYVDLYSDNASDDREFEAQQIVAVADFIVKKWPDPPEGVDLVSLKQELEELKARARKTLEDGIERMRKTGEVTRVLATAVLYLGQIYVDTNEAAKAIALLEDPKIGALTLVGENNAA